MKKKSEKDEWEVRWVFSFSVAEQPFLGKSLSILSVEMKENEEASILRLTIDHGLHDAPSVVTSVSKFAVSSFPPRA